MRYRAKWFGAMLAAMMQGFGVHAGERMLDRRAFTQAFVAELHRQAPEAKAELQELDGSFAVAMTWPDGVQGTWLAANAFADYRREPKRLVAILEASVRSQVEAHARAGTPPAADADVARVLPVIRTLEWVEATRAQLTSVIADAAKRDDAMPLYEPLAGDLLVAYAIDGDAGMTYVSRGELARLGFADLATLGARARTNLAGHLGSLQVTGRDGRYRLELDANHEASMALLADRWRDRVHVDGDLVLAIPSRETVLICGSADADAIETLRGFADSISRRTTYHLSRRLYRYRDGRLSTYDGERTLPPPAPPAQAR